MNNESEGKSSMGAKEKYSTLKIIISILLQPVFIGIILILLLLEIKNISMVVILSGVVAIAILDLIIMLILFNTQNTVPEENIEDKETENYDYENIDVACENAANLLDDVKGETKLIHDETMILERQATLEINTGSRGGVELINSESFIVGRQYKLQGWIENTEVSRKHFEIFKLEKDYYIRDLSSKNGTKVNGIKLDIDEEKRLNDKDIIEIPHLVITFRL